MAVVIPAHNEAVRLPRCLSSLVTARRHPALREVAVFVVVVADACTDSTAAVAAQEGADAVVEIAWQNVGAARRAGVEAAVRNIQHDSDGTWVVTTDADSHVPFRWLAHQRALALRGWDCSVGTVRLHDWPAHHARLAERHERHYFATRPRPFGHLWAHPHVHGANLGFTAVAYESVGGFQPMASGEDRALVEALRRSGHAVLSTDQHPVITSAREDYRAPHGFGAFLHRPASLEETP